MALLARGLLIILVQLLHHVGSALASAPPPPPVRVQSTCNSTSFYDLYVASLVADPSSSTADVRGLCAIALSAAAANGSTTTSFFLANASSTSADEASLLRSCADKYSNARDALLDARVSVAEEEAYDYALVHVSAAAEYPAVRRTLFRRRRRSYPTEIARREEGLRRLCTIALDIISQLLQMHEHS